MKRFKIVFENGYVLKATLLEEKSPKTCEAFWKSLPFNANFTQSRWSGREINFEKSFISPLPAENQTIYTSIGEICYWKDMRGEASASPPQAIAIYYGAELARSNKGEEIVNVFAQIDYENIENLKNVGEEVWLEGVKEAYFDFL